MWKDFRHCLKAHMLHYTHTMFRKQQLLKCVWVFRQWKKSLCLRMMCHVLFQVMIFADDGSKFCHKNIDLITFVLTSKVTVAWIADIIQADVSLNDFAKTKTLTYIYIYIYIYIYTLVSPLIFRTGHLWHAFYCLCNQGWSKILDKALTSIMYAM